MGRSFFIWNGIDSRSMGVFLEGPPAIIRPEERVKHIEIPGRSGDLTQLEGEEIFNSYIQTVTLQIPSALQVQRAMNWLQGKGKVTFSGQPNLQQDARIIGAITMNKFSHHLDWYTGEMQMYCQPFKERIRDAAIIVSVTDTKIRNFGDIRSKPRITLTISASAAEVSTETSNISEGAEEADEPTATAEIMINNRIFALDLTDVSDTVIIIDSETETVTNGDGSVSLAPCILTDRFPMLDTGDNTIAFTSNISSVAILRRERWL